MSRVWKLPIQLPTWVEVNIKGNNITVKWSKWELTYDFLPQVNVKVEDNEWKKEVVVELLEQSQPQFWWLTRALIANMVVWVDKGYKKELMVLGVWYNAKLEGKKLVLSLWLSHQVFYEAPEEVKLTMAKWSKWEAIIVIEGIDKQKVWEVAAKIRAFKKPEPYKGKGIRYKDEVVKLKAGKAAK